MKALGATLLLLSAVCGFAQYRHRKITLLRLRRAFATDLAVLKNGICIYRRTLPAICDRDLCSSYSARWFWIPLSMFLSEGNLPVRRCWERAAENLPEQIGMRLFPIGSLLGGGGDSLACVIDETRNELLRDLQEEEARISSAMRLAGALYLSGACFLILVLL